MWLLENKEWEWTSAWKPKQIASRIFYNNAYGAEYMHWQKSCLGFTPAEEIKVKFYLWESFPKPPNRKPETVRWRQKNSLCKTRGFLWLNIIATLNATILRKIECKVTESLTVRCREKLVTAVGSTLISAYSFQYFRSHIRLHFKNVIIQQIKL